MGYLSPDGSHVAQHTLDEAVDLAICGELYKLPASHFIASTCVLPIATTISSIIPSSAGNRVFVVGEIVDVILHWFSAILIDDLCPHPVPGMPPALWAHNHRGLAQVNSTCFFAVTPRLWSYTPKYSFLSAVITDVRYRKWTRTPSATQL